MKEFFFGAPIQQPKISNIICSKFTEKYIGTTFTVEANLGHKLLFLSFESEVMHTVHTTLRCQINEEPFYGIPLIKVSKFQNELMKSSFLPKYEPNTYCKALPRKRKIIPDFPNCFPS